MGAARQRTDRAQSISDQQLFVHQKDPHEYVEIVTVPKAAADAKAPAADAKAPAADAKAPAADAKAGAADANAAKPAEGKVLVRIRTDRVGADGKPIGLKEAERLASNEIRRLKRRGIEATINVRNVARVHLYTVGSDGTLECRDAESGQPIWLVRVGDRRLPYLSMGINEEFLTIINGSNLIKVEAATGEVMEEVRMSGARGSAHSTRVTLP